MTSPLISNYPHDLSPFPTFYENDDNEISKDTLSTYNILNAAENNEEVSHTPHGPADNSSDIYLVVHDQNMATSPFQKHIAESRFLTSQIIACLDLPPTIAYYRPLIERMFKALPQLQRKEHFAQNYMYNLNELIKRLMLVWLSYSALEDDIRSIEYLAECRITLEYLHDVTSPCPIPMLQTDQLDGRSIWCFKRIAYIRAMADAGQVCDRCISTASCLNPEILPLRKYCLPFATTGFFNNSIQEISLAFTDAFHQQLLKTIQTALPQ